MPASASASNSGRGSSRSASVWSAQAWIWGASFRAASSGAAVTGLAPLLDDRARRGQQPRDLDLLAIDQRRHPRRDLVLPVLALVDEVVEALALRLALEAAEPHVHALVLLADEASENDHAHLHLERDDLLLHALHPRLLLSRMDVVLPELEEHSGLLEHGAPSPLEHGGHATQDPQAPLNMAATQLRTPKPPS